MIEYHSRQGRLSRVFSWAIITILMVGSLSLVDQNANFYQTSILQSPTSAPFDGTVSPVANVPDWVHLSGSDATASYSELKRQNKLVALPYYDANEIATPVSDLKWGNDAHDKIRNEKITYSVPYLGNYKLDGKENVGSHLAVDIKCATGTPVSAIANGVVTKSVSQSTGFGKHIVIKHVAAPSLENPNIKETLYSSYSHLNGLNVSEGDVVKKGQIIGYTGETGTATTPHLHFQIDKASSEWHPYWPFTWKDAQDAGVSFWDAINIGLGMADAKKYTIHPMKYVQKYYEGVKDSDVEIPKEDKIDPPKEDNSSSNVTVTNKFNVKFTTQKEYDVEDGKVVIIVRLFDENGKVYNDGFGSYLKISLKNNDSKIDKTTLTADNFVSGKTKITLTQLLPGSTQLVAEYGDQKFYSATFELKPGEVKTDSGDTVENPLPGFFNDVAKSNDHYVAIKYLYDQKIISGYSDGTFKPDNAVTRVEALKFITEALLSSKEKVYDPKTLPFKDTAVGVWYSGYVATASVNGLINGYPDNTFRPGQNVNLAEFSKIALNATKAHVSESVDEDPYNDVSKDLWFAPIVSYAKSKNILDEKRSKIYPGEAMTRGEVAEFIFRVLVLRETGARKYDERLHADVRGLNI